MQALYENMLVELPFAGFFLSKLLGTSADVDIHHLASLDPEVYRNLLFLKSYGGDVEELGLNFTVVNNDLGEAQVRRAGRRLLRCRGTCQQAPGPRRRAQWPEDLPSHMRYCPSFCSLDFRSPRGSLCLQERGIWLFLCPSIVF